MNEKERLDLITQKIIGAAIEVHRQWDQDCWNPPTKPALPLNYFNMR